MKLKKARKEVRKLFGKKGSKFVNSAENYIEAVNESNRARNEFGNLFGSKFGHEVVEVLNRFTSAIKNENQPQETELKLSRLAVEGLFGDKHGPEVAEKLEVFFRAIGENVALALRRR